jgi:hypothetical protein
MMGIPPKAGAERRLTRTTDPLVALSRLFESARRAGSLEAVVLADEMGLAIAGAGAASLCDELAAHAAVLTAAAPANDTVPCRLDVVARAARIRRLRIDGIEVLLCAERRAGARPGGLRALGGCGSRKSRGKRLEPIRLRGTPRRDVGSAARMSGFVDLHCHCVPGIDDGVRSIDERRWPSCGRSDKPASTRSSRRRTCARACSTTRPPI